MLPLFKWAARYEDSRYSDSAPHVCPYCIFDLQERIIGFPKKEYGSLIIDRVCPRCGFDVSATFSGYEGWGSSGDEYIECSQARLMQLSIESPQIALEEVAAYLKLHRSAITDISPYRFEELMADTLKNLGWGVCHTPKTWDGGYDLMLLRDGISYAIVECKRYSNTIGVSLVRELAGVCLDLNIKRAKLIATTTFSREAEKYGQRMKERGYEFDLLGAEAIFELLEIYNNELPKINSLTEEQLLDIQGRSKQIG